MNRLLPAPPLKSTDDKYIWVAWAQNFWKANDSQMHLYQKAGDPALAEIYVNTWAIYKNTSTGAVKLWCNDNGTLKSVALV
jgi:hypothetical protein